MVDATHVYALCVECMDCVRQVWYTIERVTHMAYGRIGLHADCDA